MNNLRSSAYEAVMELVKNSPKDVYPTIQKIVVAILSKMDAILKMERSGSHIGDHSQHNDFKSLLCAALQVIALWFFYHIIIYAQLILIWQ